MSKKNQQLNCEKLITVDELSQILGIRKDFIYKSKQTLQIPFYKIGGSVRFRLSEINKWIDERKIAV